MYSVEHKSDGSRCAGRKYVVRLVVELECAGTNLRLWCITCSLHRRWWGPARPSDALNLKPLTASSDRSFTQLPPLPPRIPLLLDLTAHSRHVLLRAIEGCSFGCILCHSVAWQRPSRPGHLTSTPPCSYAPLCLTNRKRTASMLLPTPLPGRRRGTLLFRMCLR
jgi:hypothetical protein